MVYVPILVRCTIHQPLELVHVSIPKSMHFLIVQIVHVPAMELVFMMQNVYVITVGLDQTVSHNAQNAYMVHVLKKVPVYANQDIGGYFAIECVQLQLKTQSVLVMVHVHHKVHVSVLLDIQVMGVTTKQVF